MCLSHQKQSPQERLSICKAVPLRPSQALMRRKGSIHDGLLIGAAEWLRKAGQRGLHEPRFSAQASRIEPRDRADRATRAALDFEREADEAEAAFAVFIEVFHMGEAQIAARSRETDEEI